MQIAEWMGLPLTGYGLGAACAVLVFWLTSALYLRRVKACYGRFCVYALCTAVFGWAVSRLVFALCTFPTYLNEYDGYFAPALYFWDGGYAMTGAILGVILGAWLAAKLTGLRAGDALNAAGLGLPLGVAVLRLTEFLTDLPQSGDVGEGNYIDEGWVSDLLSRFGLLMQADGDYCYPACLLACLFAALIFVGLCVWLLCRKDALPGDVLMVSLVFICLGQIILEPLRNDGHLTFHFVPFQQVIALVIYVAVLSVWLRRHRKLSVNKRLSVVVGAIASVCIVVGVIASFMIDRYENKVVAWSLLIGPVIVMGISALYMRAATNYLQGE